MKLDTSSYYPKSQLSEFDDEANASAPQAAQHPESELNAEPQAASEPTASPLPEAEDDGYEAPEPEPEGAFADFLTRVSNLLSWVFVPLLMPVYGVILAFSLSILSFTGIGTRFIFTLIVFAFNVLAPALLFGLLKKFGVISDIGLNRRTERTLPYLICILGLVGTAIFMWSKGAPMWLVMFFGGGAAAGVVELIVNHWWKISVHAAGIAGIVALLVRILLSGYPQPQITIWLIIAIAAAGLLGSARVWLGRHTVSQVMAGYVVGFCSVFFLTMIGL